MSATITYLAAREHINDLLRDAEHSRHVAETRRRPRIRLALPRLTARRTPRTATA
ncbi:MAG: hypothetical protein M3Y09_05610 [Actinomycetota bacterium]|nr:hypothetical protein [Actinomycetota bacterium]